ncbi:RHS repeat protein [Microlunatus sp. Gsoil 973]|uniref:RHS repeat protein n=1 Tax=Microlunatus sp. Gsoil 973 TaxID=2672569 RepID=UPI0012B484A9|nr:RHS repeat protein [Microlunatus sp. Gsoil 973]QGN31480.1 hypothetical protein GJV80_00040 [Microlunatus sp. Gsoil 973]
MIVAARSEAVTRYTYQGDSRDPFRMFDPEGGVTEMIWSDGLLKQVTDPVGVTVTFDHDQHGELLAATDGDGDTARLERDDLGRVAAAITPLGYRTTYRYDGAGPLFVRAPTPMVRCGVTVQAPAAAGPRSSTQGRPHRDRIRPR